VAKSPQDVYGKWAGYNPGGDSVNITSTPQGNDYFSNLYLNGDGMKPTINSVPVSGVGIVTDLVLPALTYHDMDEHDIKKILVHELAEKIYKFGYVEFTRVPDIINDNMIVKARIFVTPNDKVKLLRTINPDLFK
jgi:hypothetical protein